MNNRAVRYLGLVVALALSASAVAAEPAVKKLIEFGWDAPTPAFVKVHVRDMERRPFDGVVLRIPGFDLAFDRKAWEEAALAPQLDALRGIEWQRFTDNFAVLGATAEGGLDWFDDARWAQIARNLRLASRAAKEGRLAGVVFDPEPYGGSPWLFPAAGAGAARSFAEVEAEARRRGAQCLRALRAESPDLRVLLLFGLGIFGADVDRPDRETWLPGHFYALLPAFLAGLLDAAGEGAKIVDGHEPSYYYGLPEDFARGRRAVLERAPALLAPADRERYRARVEAGMAVYVDFALALWKAENDYAPLHATPAERLQWLEHNVYRALETSERYVWVYGEDLDWWNGRLPEGAEAAIRSAREKLSRGAPLGFDTQDLVARAKAATDAAVASRAVKWDAEPSRLPEGAQRPRVDGKPVEKEWQAADALEPFLKKPTALDPKPKAATVARVFADGKGIWVSFRCEEPDTARLRKGAVDRYGRPAVDSVELRFESPKGPKGSYHRFSITATGDRAWATGWADGEAALWDERFLGTADIGKKEWTAELEIPWDLLGASPSPAAPWRAILCRRRAEPAETSCYDHVTFR